MAIRGIFLTVNNKEKKLWKNSKNNKHKLREELFGYRKKYLKVPFHR